MKQHQYKATIEWTGNKGSGTFDYRSYSRSHSIILEGKREILGSSDSSFRGERDKHNPEDLFLSSISSCHMLWYLHLCADAGIIVMKYVDYADGTMNLNSDGSGQFSKVLLKMCFIANSCNFPIEVEAKITVSD